MDFNFFQEIARGGFGYVLAMAIAIAYWRKDQQLRTSEDKRANDLLSTRDTIMVTVRDLLNSVQALAKTQDKMASTLDSIRWKEVPHDNV